MWRERGFYWIFMIVLYGTLLFSLIQLAGFFYQIGLTLVAPGPTITAGDISFGVMHHVGWLLLTLAAVYWVPKALKVLSGKEAS